MRPNKLRGKSKGNRQGQSAPEEVMANRDAESVCEGQDRQPGRVWIVILAVTFLTLQTFPFITLVYVFIMMTLGFDYCYFLPSLILPGEGVG